MDADETVDNIEDLCCNWRGIKLHAESVVHMVKSVSMLESMKITARKNPKDLPDSLQCIEYELGEVVKDAAALLREAGDAINKCHTLRQSMRG
jgi:hypothetical protein